MKARIILVFVLLAATSLSAQTFRGTILGTVTDPSGAVVAGAKVTVKNVGTGLERTTDTSADGSYALPELPIGTYTVTITLTGFQTAVTTGVAVDVATERRVDAALKTGQVSTRVEVSADQLPLVETTSNTLGGVLTQNDVKDLPINGRDYTKLIFLNPGVAGSPDQITDSPGSFGEFSMNGARGRSNNYLLASHHWPLWNRLCKKQFPWPDRRRALADERRILARGIRAAFAGCPRRPLRRSCRAGERSREQTACRVYYRAPSGRRWHSRSHARLLAASARAVPADGHTFHPR